jgi:hypothetical protein
MEVKENIRFPGIHIGPFAGFFSEKVNNGILQTQ